MLCKLDQDQINIPQKVKKKIKKDPNKIVNKNKKREAFLNMIMCKVNKMMQFSQIIHNLIQSCMRKKKSISVNCAKETDQYLLLKQMI